MKGQVILWPYHVQMIMLKVIKMDGAVFVSANLPGGVVARSQFAYDWGPETSVCR